MKLPPVYLSLKTIESLPVRGAWVEMFGSSIVLIFRTVAPRAGSVG